MYLYSEFRVQECYTYHVHSGILGEVEDWVNPLLSNEQLRGAFLHYIHPPRTLEKLKALTAFVSG